MTLGLRRSIETSTAPVLCVAEQHALPGLAAVAALVEAALLAWPAVLAEAGDEDDVVIGGMNADPRDRVRVAEAELRPGLSGVGGLVDAVAGHDVAADARLAHADVDHVGVRLGDGDGADRRTADLAVGDRRPGVARVDGLPQAAAHRAEVGVERTAFDAAHRNRSTAAVGADAAPARGLENRLLRSRDGGGRCGGLRRGWRLRAGGP